MINTFGGEILLFLIYLTSIRYLFLIRIGQKNNEMIKNDFVVNEKKKCQVKNENDDQNERNDVISSQQKKSKKFTADLVHMSNDKIFEIVLILVWSTYRIFVLTMSCLCALLHRRHLMVWAIFAPKVSTRTYVHIL